MYGPECFFGIHIFKPIIKTAAFDVELDGHLTPRRFCATVDLNGQDMWIFHMSITANKLLEHSDIVYQLIQLMAFSSTNMEATAMEASSRAMDRSRPSAASGRDVIISSKRQNEKSAADRGGAPISSCGVLVFWDVLVVYRTVKPI